MKDFTRIRYVDVNEVKPGDVVMFKRKMASSGPYQVLSASPSRGGWARLQVRRLRAYADHEFVWRRGPVARLTDEPTIANGGLT